MARQGEEDNGSLDSALDSVFGPMNSAGAEDSDDTNADDDAGSSDEGEGGAQRTTQQKTEGEGEGDLLEGLAPRLNGKPQRDANGNIVDAQGRIVAMTREERREVYNFNRMRTAAEHYKKTGEELQRQLQGVQQYVDAMKQHNVTPQQATEALQFRARIESDPVSAVRDIVARVLGNGYTMEQLFGGEAAGYINAQMLNQQLEQRLRPLNERIASDEREQRIRETAERDMNSFLQEHEYADVHGEAIAHLVQTRDMTPQKAYYELRHFAATNGLDFSQSLREQIAQRLEAGNGDGGQPPQQQQRRTAPSTPGGTRAPNGVQQSSVQDNSYAAPDSSYRSIVEDAMRGIARGATYQ